MTSVFGVIGYPIGHSLSPPMHNTAFREVGYDGIYVPFEIKPENFEKAIDGLLALGIEGVNVTIPYKERIVDFFEKEDEVYEIGAANTVDLRKKKCYNTDVYGVIQAISSSGIEPKNLKILVVGAGGASKACIYALKNNNEVFITNRTPEKGIRVAKRFEVEFIYSDQLIKEKFDLIVNATPLGMKGFPEKLPVPKDLLKNKPILFDMVYNPMETPLIKTGKRYRCKIISGIEMLVFQGAKSFEIFTGKKAPIEVMRRTVISELKKLS